MSKASVEMIHSGARGVAKRLTRPSIETFLTIAGYTQEKATEITTKCVEYLQFGANTRNIFPDTLRKNMEDLSVNSLVETIPTACTEILLRAASHKALGIEQPELMSKLTHLGTYSYGSGEPVVPKELSTALRKMLDEHPDMIAYRATCAEIAETKDDERKRDLKKTLKDLLADMSDIAMDLADTVYGIE